MTASNTQMARKEKAELAGIKRMEANVIIINVEE